MDFQVGPQVLIPRPESEVLVEQAVLLYKKGLMPGGEHLQILDLGTGSGALAVAVAREIRSASLWASDISEEALDIARINAERHGVGERIQFKKGDLLTHFRPEEVTFDLILSNPPYITSLEFDGLPPEVRNFEPRLALDGREDGLYFIQEIIHQAPENLNDHGWLLLEMDPRQIPKALELISKDGRYGHADRIRDYSHRERVVISQKR